MKIFCQSETVNEREARLTNWHPFFAILPRWDGVQCWHVGRIERKLTSCSDGYDAEYRETRP